MHISLLDFIKRGQFGNIELGLTKSDIEAKFCTPDDFWDAGQGMSIWRYSTLELHFLDETLVLIWCDCLELIQDTNKFSIDMWLFNDLDKLTYQYFRSQLDRIGLRYSVKENNYSMNKLPDSVVLSIEETPVIIYFEDKRELQTSVEDYYLIAIGASAR